MFEIIADLSIQLDLKLKYLQQKGIGLAVPILSEILVHYLVMIKLHMATVLYLVNVSNT